MKELADQKKKLQTLEEDLKRKVNEYDSAREALQKKMISDISQ